jgi:hypothetical protein
MTAITEDIPGGYFVDAQGDVTWGGLPAGPYQGKPSLVLPKEADIRYRNFRFPDTEKAVGRRPDPAIPVKIVRDADVADWAGFIKRFRPGDS